MLCKLKLLTDLKQNWINFAATRNYFTTTVSKYKKNGSRIVISNCTEVILLQF